MLKIEHGCIFLRRAGDKLEGVALLTRQLENADDSIEFFIRRFRLGDTALYFSCIVGGFPWSRKLVDIVAI